jgi:hypothetical protein
MALVIDNELTIVPTVKAREIPMKSLNGGPSVVRNKVGAKRSLAASQSTAPNGNNDTIVDYNLLSPSVPAFLKNRESEKSKKGSKRVSALSRIGSAITRDKDESGFTTERPDCQQQAIFDYATVPPSVATFLKNQGERIRRCGASFVVNIGKDLIGAKRYLSHGAFLCWVEAEAGIPARAAQVYMQVAQWVGGKGATVAHLPLTALYLLSARSTPNEFTKDVLNRVQRGETISLTALRAELKIDCHRFIEIQHRSETYGRHRRSRLCPFWSRTAYLAEIEKTKDSDAEVREETFVHQP